MLPNASVKEDTVPYFFPYLEKHQERRDYSFLQRIQLFSFTGDRTALIHLTSRLCPTITHAPHIIEVFKTIFSLPSDDREPLVSLCEPFAKNFRFFKLITTLLLSLKELPKEQRETFTQNFSPLIHLARIPRNITELFEKTVHDTQNVQVYTLNRLQSFSWLATTFQEKLALYSTLSQFEEGPFTDRIISFCIEAHQTTWRLGETLTLLQQFHEKKHTLEKLDLKILLPFVRKLSSKKGITSLITTLDKLGPEKCVPYLTLLHPFAKVVAPNDQLFSLVQLLEEKGVTHAETVLPSMTCLLRDNTPKQILERQLKVVLEQTHEDLETIVECTKNLIPSHVTHFDWSDLLKAFASMPKHKRLHYMQIITPIVPLIKKSSYTHQIIDTSCTLEETHLIEWVKQVAPLQKTLLKQRDTWLLLHLSATCAVEDLSCMLVELESLCLSSLPHYLQRDVLAHLLSQDPKAYLPILRLFNLLFPLQLPIEKAVEKMRFSIKLYTEEHITAENLSNQKAYQKLLNHAVLKRDKEFCSLCFSLGASFFQKSEEAGSCNEIFLLSHKSLVSSKLRSQLDRDFLNFLLEQPAIFNDDRFPRFLEQLPLPTLRMLLLTTKSQHLFQPNGRKELVEKALRNHIEHLEQRVEATYASLKKWELHRTQTFPTTPTSKSFPYQMIHFWRDAVYVEHEVEDLTKNLFKLSLAPRMFEEKKPAPLYPKSIEYAKELLTLFDRFAPALIRGKYTKEEVRKNFTNLLPTLQQHRFYTGVPKTEEEKEAFYTLCENYWRGIVVKLKEQKDPAALLSPLLDIFLGFYLCAGRWEEEACHHYHLLYQTDSLHDPFETFLHDLRVDAFKKTVKELHGDRGRATEIHTETLFLFRTQKDLQLFLPKKGWNDPYGANISAEEIKKTFYKYYTAECIISSFENKMNAQDCTSEMEAYICSLLKDKAFFVLKPQTYLKDKRLLNASFETLFATVSSMKRPQFSIASYFIQQTKSIPLEEVLHVVLEEIEAFCSEEKLQWQESLRSTEQIRCAFLNDLFVTDPMQRTLPLQIELPPPFQMVQRLLTHFSPSHEKWPLVELLRDFPSLWKPFLASLFQVKTSLGFLDEVRKLDKVLFIKKVFKDTLPTLPSTTSLYRQLFEESNKGRFKKRLLRSLHAHLLQVHQDLFLSSCYETDKEGEAKLFDVRGWPLIESPDPLFPVLQDQLGNTVTKPVRHFKKEALLFVLKERGVLL